MKRYGLLFFLVFCTSNIAIAQPESNECFLQSKGTWDYPAAASILKTFNNVYDHYYSKAATFESDSALPVKAVFDGTVVLVNEYDSLYMVVIKYADYFIGYSNLEKSSVNRNDSLKAGDIIGIMGKDLDDHFTVGLQLSSKSQDIDILPWFKKNITAPSSQP